MAVMLWVVGLLVGVVTVPALIWFIIWNKSFIHKVWIAKQSGKEVTDVIWMEDKCKVKDKDGEHIIVLKRHRGSSPSFAGEFWTKVFKNSSMVIRDEWGKQQIRKNLRRGLFLYQTTEGEFHPIGISEDGQHHVFKVLSQDNRGFTLRKFSEINELSLNSRRQMWIYLGIIVGFIILGVAFVLFLVYLTETAGKMCQIAGPTFVDTAINTVGG